MTHAVITYYTSYYRGAEMCYRRDLQAKISEHHITRSHEINVALLKSDSN